MPQLTSSPFSSLPEGTPPVLPAGQSLIYAEDDGQFGSARSYFGTIHIIGQLSLIVMATAVVIFYSEQLFIIMSILILLMVLLSVYINFKKRQTTKQQENPDRPFVILSQESYKAGEEVHFIVKKRLENFRVTNLSGYVEVACTEFTTSGAGSDSMQTSVDLWKEKITTKLHTRGEHVYAEGSFQLPAHLPPNTRGKKQWTTWSMRFLLVGEYTSADWENVKHEQVATTLSRLPKGTPVEKLAELREDLYTQLEAQPDHFYADGNIVKITLPVR